MKRWLRNVCFRLRALFHNGRKESELGEEIEHHLGILRREFEEKGMSGEEARKAALREFGNMEAIKEGSRENWGVHTATCVMKEFRLGLRLLWKSKVFTAAVVLTLALCIAGNTVIFTLLSGVLGPPDYPDPDRVVQVWAAYPGIGGESGRMGGVNSASRLVDFYNNADHFESLTLIQNRDVNISLEGSSFRSRGLYVTKGFFEVTGVDPFSGRYFAESDYSVEGGEAHFYIVLAEPFWRNQLGADRDIVGKTVYLNSLPNKVIGIAPARVGSHFGKPDFYRIYPNPFKFPQDRLDRSRHGNAYPIWGRLKPGVTQAQAKAQLDNLDRLHYERSDSELKGFIDRSQYEARMATHQQISANNEGRLLYLLQGSVLMVLLIGCLNVANLLVARGFGRRSEFALRAAVGASRLVLIRQLLIECVVLALASSVIGYGLALGAMGLVREYLSIDLIVYSPEGALSLGSSSLLFLIAVSLGVGLLLGVFASISLLFSKQNLASSMHGESGKATANKSIRYVRSSLVSAQVALTVLLLVGAGLLIQSFQKALNTNPGIETENIYVSKLGLAWGKYEKGENDGGARKIRFRDQFRASLMEIPGVESVTFTPYLPMLDEMGHWSGIALQDSPHRPEDGLVSAHVTVVPEDFFETFGIPLLRGRYFDFSDKSRPEGVFIVDRSFAERYYKGVDPVGKYVGWGESFSFGDNDPSEVPMIVGVVENIKHLGLDHWESSRDAPSSPMMYRLEIDRALSTDFSVAIKGSRPLDNLFPIVQRKALEIDDQLPLYMNDTLENLIEGSLDDRRTFMLLITILSAMALILSAIGIYGVLAYDVIQRTQEIGLRLALGSTRDGILNLFMKQGSIKVFAGLLIGLVCAALLSSRISDFLYQVEPTEPMSFAMVAVFVLIIAALATYLPARKALRVEPMQALRVE